MVVEIDQCTEMLSEIRKDLVMKGIRTEIMRVSFIKKKKKQKKTLVTAGLPGISLRYFGGTSIHQPETC